MEQSLKVERFNGNGDDFGLWFMRTQTLLEAAGLMYIVRGEATKPGPVNTNVSGVQISSTGEIEDFNKGVIKARAILVHSLGDRPLRAVQKVFNDPAKIWKKLHERYATCDSASRIQLQMLLHSKRMGPNEQMGDYVASFESIFERLAGMNCAVSEDMQVVILLSSLSSNTIYENVVGALKTLLKEDLT